jgi:hypothetical protein
MKPACLAVGLTILIMALSTAAQVKDTNKDNGKKENDYNPAPWVGQIEGQNRFTVLKQWNDEAVLDRETGLLWERSPSNAPAGNWYGAYNTCLGKTIGGRWGWRRPAFEELASLVATTSAIPTLPIQHPFANVPGEFLSATTQLAGNNALAIQFGIGAIAREKSTPGRVWCVRGGHGFEGQS